MLGYKLITKQTGEAGRICSKVSDCNTGNIVYLYYLYVLVVCVYKCDMAHLV